VKPQTSEFLIPGPVGALEVVLDEPAVAGQTANVSRVGVICHPHPLQGGTLTHKVLHILARMFNELGMPAIRFNFRGVGKSEGTHDDGRGEVDDVLAVIEYAEKRWPDAQIWLAGFSFGAAMALRASLQYPAKRLVTVAPALRWLTQLSDSVPDCPWLIVQGDHDELVDVDAVREWVAKLPKAPTLKILPGAEHFFHGRLNDLRDTVALWISSPN